MENRNKIGLTSLIFAIIYILGVLAFLGIVTLYRINLKEEVSFKFDYWDMASAFTIPLISLIYPYYLTIKRLNKTKEPKEPKE